MGTDQDTGSRAQNMGKHGQDTGSQPVASAIGHNDLHAKHGQTRADAIISHTHARAHAPAQARPHAPGNSESNGEMPVSARVLTFADIPLRVTALPTKPGEPEPAQRLKAWLKCGLREYGIRVEWGEPSDTAGTAAKDDEVEVF